MDPRNSRKLDRAIKFFKASMIFRNLDFDTDKAAQYSVVREKMVAVYCDNKTLFGQLRLQIGLRNLVNCHKKIRLQCKKRSKYKKF